MISHVTIAETSGTLKDWKPVFNQLKDKEGVIGAAPFIEKQVMLTSQFGSPQGVQLSGILPQYQKKVSQVYLPKYMLAGGLEGLAARQYGIVLGVDLAARLDVGMGDKVTVISPKARVTPAGLIPRMKRFTVIGIFQMRMQEYDGATAYIHLDDATRLFSMHEGITGLRLKLDDLFKADQASIDLQKEMGNHFYVKSWSVDNASLFHAFKMEKVMMFIVLGLIVIVALFNLVASLVMMVKEKSSEIAILRTLGMSPSSVAKIFIIQGSLIGIIGTTLGVILGVLIATNVETIAPAIESLLGHKLFDENVFFTSDIPSDMHIGEVVFVAIASFVSSILATIYPARQAAAIHPAESLRYE